MNDIEILEKYIDLINKGYCDDCNELNCIDNFPHKKIAQAIENLIEKQKAELDKKDRIIDAMEKILNNICQKMFIISYIFVINVKVTTRNVTEIIA